MAGVVLTKKPSLGKRFFIISILALILCSLIIVSTMYAPFWPFFPVQRIDALPKQEDLLVFTASMFTTRDTRDYSSLFVLSQETGTLYNWHKFVNVTNHYWTGTQDRVLVRTGSSYREEPIKPFLVSTDGGIQQIDDIFSDGVLSPNGNKIAYTKDFSLLIYDLKTKQTNKLTPTDVWATEFSWSPDSNHIAFISPDKPDKENYSFEILSVDIRDETLLRLRQKIAGITATNLQWSGDSTKLSFDYHSGNCCENRETLIIPIDRMLSPQSLGRFNRCESHLRSYAWLHQGSRLSVLCVGETVKLWIIDTDTKQTDIRKLEELDLKIGFGPHNMAWSPDDTKLAFSAVGNDAHYWGSADGGTLICSEDIYIFDTEKNTLTKIPLTHWLSVIQNMVWVKISQ